jgi:hypothetical protein
MIYTVSTFKQGASGATWRAVRCGTPEIARYHLHQMVRAATLSWPENFLDKWPEELARTARGKPARASVTFPETGWAVSMDVQV